MRYFSLINHRIKNTLLCPFAEISSRNYDIPNTIVVSGSPRSGTTWLAELFTSAPGAEILWEPLHLRNQPDLKRLGFNWRTIIRPERNWPEAKKVFNDILTGRRLNWHTASVCGIKGALGRKFWIVKFVRANGLLEWMADTFPIKTPCVIIRHPCAVVSSQMHRRTLHKTVTEKVALAKLRSGDSDGVTSKFLELYPKFAPVLERVKTWEELLASSWCMDTYHIVSVSKNPPWVLVPYEKLVTSGEPVLKSLLSFYGLPQSKDLIRNLVRPSSTVVGGSNVAKGVNPLIGWRSKLDKAQVKRILSVVRDFGFNFYNHKSEPDYDFLNTKSQLKL